MILKGEFPETLYGVGMHIFWNKTLVSYKLMHNNGFFSEFWMDLINIFKLNWNIHVEGKNDNSGISVHEVSGLLYCFLLQVFILLWRGWKKSCQKAPARILN